MTNRLSQRKAQPNQNQMSGRYWLHSDQHLSDASADHSMDSDPRLPFLGWTPDRVHRSDTLRITAAIPSWSVGRPCLR